MRKKTMKLALVLLGIFCLSLVFSLIAGKIGEATGPREIVVLRLHGSIGSSGAEGELDREKTKEQLSILADDPLVSGVVLEINSPGGDVAPTADITYSIEKLSEKKPVVSYTSDLAASGGYWLLASANKTIVAPLSLVGSIGVFSDVIDASGLLSKIGVNMSVIKAGEYKDAGTFSRALTDEERRQMQEIVTKIHQEFISSVSKKRGIPEDELLSLSQGQIFLGRDAAALGLADSVGGEEDAIELARDLSGCDSCLVTDVSITSDWEDFIGSFSNYLGEKLGSGFLSALSRGKSQVRV